MCKLSVALATGSRPTSDQIHAHGPSRAAQQTEIANLTCPLICSYHLHNLSGFLLAHYQKTKLREAKVAGRYERKQIIHVIIH
jgi:hypothetical protein